METKKQMYEQTKQKQAHRYREQIGCCQMGEGLKGQVKKAKGLRCTNYQLQKQSWGCKVQHREHNE